MRALRHPLILMLLWAIAVIGAGEGLEAIGVSRTAIGIGILIFTGLFILGARQIRGGQLP